MLAAEQSISSTSNDLNMPFFSHLDFPANRQTVDFLTGLLEFWLMDGVQCVWSFITNSEDLVEVRPLKMFVQLKIEI